MTDAPTTLIDIMRQKGRGERNRVGDLWGDQWCLEAADALEAAERVIAPFAEFHVGVSAYDHAVAACSTFTIMDTLPVGAFRAARDWQLRHATTQRQGGDDG